MKMRMKMILKRLKMDCSVRMIQLTIIAIIMAHKLTVSSYNSTGLNQERKQFIKKTLENDSTIDIFMLQETWLFKKDINSMNGIHDSYVCHCVSGIDENHHILQGRPYEWAACNNCFNLGYM